MRFQLSDVLADGRGGEAQAPRSLSEAAEFNDRTEHGEGGEAIHNSTLSVNSHSSELHIINRIAMN